MVVTATIQNATMYAKGYRYRITIEGVPPLFVKSAMDVGPLMRRQYPDKKIVESVKVLP